jgi:hypothetical protein
LAAFFDEISRRYPELQPLVDQLLQPRLGLLEEAGVRTFAGA